MKCVKSIVAFLFFISVFLFPSVSLVAKEEAVEQSNGQNGINVKSQQVENIEGKKIEQKLEKSTVETATATNEETKTQNNVETEKKTELKNDKVKNDQVQTKDKVDADKLLLKIQVPENVITNEKSATGQVKIDNETTAKITISTKKKDVDENKEEKKEKSFLEKATDFIKNDNTTSQKEIKEYKISKKVDEKNKDNSPYVIIKDGDKNINIILQPEISNCKNCKENSKSKTNVKKNTNTKKKTKVVKKTKTVNNQNSQASIAVNKNVSSKTNENKKDSKSLEVVKVVPDGSNSENIGKSLREIYENSTLSCIGGECGKIITQVEKNEKNSTNNTTKIIEKETKVIEKPVYVINRIVNIDEDMNISDEQINQIIVKSDGEIENIKGNNTKYNGNKYASKKVDKFKQQYDIIQATELSYGEVAFIDDYND